MAVLAEVSRRSRPPEATTLLRQSRQHSMAWLWSFTVKTTVDGSLWWVVCRSRVGTSHWQQLSLTMSAHLAQDALCNPL